MSFFRSRTSAKEPIKTKNDFAVPPKKVVGQSGGPEAGGWNFTKRKVIYDTGPSGFSVAIGTNQCDSPTACGLMLAMRWNGAKNNDKDKGFPKSGVGGQWFPIPKEFAAGVIEKLRELKHLIELERLLDEWEEVPDWPSEHH